MAESIDALRDELEELRTRVQIQDAELDYLRPLAVRQRIGEAGFDPDGPAGKTLAELAIHDKTLAGSASKLAAKAAALGFTTDNTPLPPARRPDEDSVLTDPRYSADHPRNQPGTHANQVARLEADKAQKTTAVLDQMRRADVDGHLSGPAQDPLTSYLAAKGAQPEPTPTARTRPRRIRRRPAGRILEEVKVDHHTDARRRISTPNADA